MSQDLRGNLILGHKPAHRKIGSSRIGGSLFTAQSGIMKKHFSLSQANTMTEKIIFENDWSAECDRNSAFVTDREVSDDLFGILVNDDFLHLLWDIRQRIRLDLALLDYGFRGDPVPVTVTSEDGSEIIDSARLSDADDLAWFVNDEGAEDFTLYADSEKPYLIACSADSNGDEKITRVYCGDPARYPDLAKAAPEKTGAKRRRAPLIRCAIPTSSGDYA